MAPRHPDLSQAIWRKSTYSSSTGQNCVEVATNIPDFVAVHDSKKPGGSKLLFSHAEWNAFVQVLKATGPADGNFWVTYTKSSPRLQRCHSKTFMAISANTEDPPG